MRNLWILLLAVASASALVAPATRVHAQGDAPIVLRDTLQVRLAASNAVPLADGDLYLALESPALVGAVVLVRQGGDTARWRRQLTGVQAVAVHESGGSAILRQTNSALELRKLDPDGRLQWVAPLDPVPPPFVGAGPAAAGPGSLAGFMNAAQYCERTSADLPPRCVTLPGFASTLAAGIRIDDAGAWVHYLSSQQDIRVARIPRDGGEPVVASLAGVNREATPLAASPQAAWLRVIESGSSTMEIVRVSATGAVARTARTSADVRAVADGESLVVAFAAPSATIERFDASMQVLATAPFDGRPLNIDLGATGRTCVIGSASPEPGQVVLRCYGADLQAQPQRVLSDDADFACPCAVAVGAADALVHWGDRVGPAGSGGLPLQSVIRRVPEAGPLPALQQVDRIDASVSLGSVDALARAASGEVAIVGSGRVVDGATVRPSAWATRVSNAGDVLLQYKGPAASGEPLVVGKHDGGDLLGWSQWMQSGIVLGGLPPVYLRLHRIPPGGIGAGLVALPSPVPGQRRTTAVVPMGARWIVAGTDLVESGSGSLRFDAYVLAHDAAGTIEWQRRYVGGERGRPYIVPTQSGLVVAHAWRDTEGAPGTPTQCVVEGLSASGALLWARSGASRTCGAIAAGDPAEAVLVTAFDQSTSELLVDVLSAATGAILGSSAVPFASGSAPTAAAAVAGGWRVLGRVASEGTERLELVAFDTTPALAWRTPLQAPFGPGRPAMAVLSGGRVDVAVVSGDSTRSVLSRWRVGADGSAALLDRFAADTAGFDTLADARNFAVALAAVDGDTSLMAATLFEAGGNQVVRVSSRPDLMFQDSFD